MMTSKTTMKPKTTHPRFHHGRGSGVGEDVLQHSFMFGEVSPWHASGLPLSLRAFFLGAIEL